MTYPIKVRQQAIELRLAGLTLREIAQKLSVNSHRTILEWTDQTDDERSDAANARQQRIVQIHQEAHLEAAERFIERIPNMEDKDLVRAFSASAGANHGDLRIIQEDRKQTSLIDAMRQVLRAKDPSVLRAELLAPSTEEPPSTMLPQT